MKSKIDIDKFVASVMDSFDDHNIFMYRCFKQALEDQGLGYKDGEILEYKPVPKRQVTGVLKELRTLRKLVEHDKKSVDKVEPKFKVGNWYQCTKDFFGKGVLLTRILFTTILLVAGAVCLAFGVHATSMTMSILGGFFLGVYNYIINMKGE